jgi:hypothetical protein
MAYNVVSVLNEDSTAGISGNTLVLIIVIGALAFFLGRRYAIGHKLYQATSLDTKRALGIGISVIFLLFSLSYFTRAIYSGNHYYLIEAGAGLLFFSLVMHWLSNLSQPLARRQEVNNTIKKILKTAIISVVLILFLYIAYISIMLGSANV